jgi:hypothetical protein
MELVYELRSQLGEHRFRDLMQRPDKYDRPIRYERLGTMMEGRALLTKSEQRRLKILRDNADAIQSLGRGAEQLGKRDYKVNKSLRDWLINIGSPDKIGKHPKGTKAYNKIANKGLTALGYLGADPDKWGEYITSPE